MLAYCKLSPQCDLDQNENAVEYVVCKMSSILSRSHCIKPSSAGHIYVRNLNLVITAAADTQAPNGDDHYVKIVS